MFVECPKCLGTGEIFINKLVECNLCLGEKTVHPDLEEDFISSLHIIFEDEE